jgi:hypothetical protein
VSISNIGLQLIYAKGIDTGYIQECLKCRWKTQDSTKREKHEIEPLVLDGPTLGNKYRSLKSNGLHRIKILDSYVGVAQFESQLGPWVSWLRLMVVFVTPSRYNKYLY